MTPQISRLISITRLPIILGPVMIHSHWPYEIDSFIQHFCAGVIGFITVPFYYMVAGYLFFQHYENSIKSYKLKLSKRIKSILIPYLLWNFIAYIVYAYIQHTMQPSQFLESFWVVADKGGHSPADGPLWFLRTLIILMIVAPIFYCLSKYRYARYIVSAILIIWLLNMPGTSSGTVMGGVFFLIGCYIAVNNLDLHVQSLERYKSIIFGIFIVLVIVEKYFERESYFGTMLYNFILFVGIIVYYFLAEMIPTGKMSEVLADLGGVSFFIFAVHEMYVSPVQGIIKGLMGVNSLSYIIVFVIVSLCALGTSLLCRKVTPFLFKILSGNR